MSRERTKQNELCDDCQNFVGKDRHTKPHAGLVHTGGKKASPSTGASDESYYTCKICNHEWRYESGSGTGWIV